MAVECCYLVRDLRMWGLTTHMIPSHIPGIILAQVRCHRERNKRGWKPLPLLGAEFEPEIPTLIDVTMFLSENHRRRWYNGKEMLRLLENLSVRISVFLQMKNKNEAMEQDRLPSSSLKMINLGGRDGSV
ncbi:hypothetical protein IW261DRAFT_1428946 [Armillaria novae-zelandiae]|uniref:Uncharacterized protein n=1 Tax=Armillaria novae-zelandiae TaxID=153914 RepID=A0AA39KFX9_9AGAR|nr:hypothetical protein IW261DRAFT_1428946 [Armillaria novae-zelandiae]